MFYWLEMLLCKLKWTRWFKKEVDAENKRIMFGDNNGASEFGGLVDIVENCGTVIDLRKALESNSSEIKGLRPESLDKCILTTKIDKDSVIYVRWMMVEARWKGLRYGIWYIIFRWVKGKILRQLS